ncbi:metallophosphoesterase [Stetteria hydrogenophila]
MLVGVISDTHDNIENTVKAARFFKKEGVELVIHLGDVVSPFTLARLAEALGGVRIEAVFGNNCGEKPLLIKTAERVGANISDGPRTIEVGGKRLLILHGYGDPKTTREIVDALALGGNWDGVLYGHTHKTDYRYLQGRLILNPGEAAGVFAEPTVALLETDTLRAKIYKLKEVEVE